jgi:hypothetical protein
MLFSFVVVFKHKYFNYDLYTTFILGPSVSLSSLHKALRHSSQNQNTIPKITSRFPRAFLHCSQLPEYFILFYASHFLVVDRILLAAPLTLCSANRSCPCLLRSDAYKLIDKSFPPRRYGGEEGLTHSISIITKIVVYISRVI